MGRHGVVWCMLAFGLAGCSTTPADTSAREVSAAAMLAAGCSGCHDPAKDADTDLPGLHDRSAENIRESLLGFREGTRPGTLMPRLALGYSEAELTLISNYLGKP